ncbi:MAG TPA: right-handed parallel beta-helix repeat-containing protein [Candidatus Bathyarchaeia archaeon]|nr:right-handed parallel beta-helix repeat-containing protein [Candidatus Bathyarchaeia archaeon]
MGNTDGGLISGNTVTGLGGSDPDRLSYGISVYYGNPTVDGNHIYGCVSGANVATWASSGSDVWLGATAAITNNDFHGCDYGIISNSASPAISGNTFYGIAADDVRLDYFVKGNPTPDPFEYYNTIQAAIDAIPVTAYPVIVWVGIYSGGGTYAEALNVNKSCQIWGDSRATVTVNTVGHAYNSSGVYVTANDVVIGMLTVVGSNTNSTPRYGVKFGAVDGCWLYDVGVRNFYRTGVDILGATNLTIDDVESKDNGGNGLQSTDARGVTYQDITTNGNAWGGVGIFTYGQYTPIGTWGIVFTGSNSFGETATNVGSIYIEEGNYGTPSSPWPITYSTNPLDGANVTLQLADVTHALTGISDDSDYRVRFYATLADAQTAAAGAVSHILGGRYIMELAGTNLYVPPYLGGIQSAIDGAVPGDVIHVAAGTFDERITVNKRLTLLGATNGVSKKGFVVPALYAYDPGTQSIIRPSTDVERAVVHISADGVVFDGFVVANVVANQVLPTGGVYMDLVAVDQSLSAPTGIQILNNVLGPNTNTGSQNGNKGRCGITVYGPHVQPVKLIVMRNKIFDSKGNGGGIMIVGPYGPTYHGASYTSLFSGSVIEDNEITGNHRSGIELAGGVQGGTAPADYFVIRNNLVTNNGWFSVADKDNLKYGNGVTLIRGGSDKANADASGSRYLSFENNTVTGNEKNGFYIGPKNKDIISSGNVIQNNGLGTGGYSLWDGVRVDLAESYYAPGTAYTDYGYLTNIPFTGGTIAGSGDYGYRVIQTPALGPVDARSNWWGAQSGPYHATLNPGGTGNRVSDNVLFDPWTGKYTVSIVPAATLTNCATSKTVTFRIDRTGTSSDQVRGYDVKFSVDPAVVTAGSFVEGTFLSSAGGTSFYALDNGGGAYTVSCAILGGTAGGAGSGDLFTATLTPVAQGTSAVTITSLKVRDLANAPLAASSTNGSIRLDCTYPTMEAIAEPGNAWHNTAPTFANFGFDDDLNLDRAEYKIDGGGWTEIFSGIDATAWDNDGWVLPGFAGLSEGPHTAYFRVKDDAGNWNGEGGSQPNLYSWKFRKDTVAPSPPTNFVSMPGNNKTHLTWVNPVGDPTFDKVEVRFNRWNDYPEYGTPGSPEPSYPADHTLGTFVVLTGAQAYDDNPRTPRDIYYYAAFSKDSAGNYSVLGPSAKDRTTSYWLGDVTVDGLVGTGDLVIFSSAFGTTSGGGGWNNVCDFGPTDDWSRFGVPLPDNRIDFEDLMIFAMNWGNVTPAGLGTYVASHVAEDLKDLVKLDVVSVDENTISIVLRNRAAALKGVRLVVTVSGADLQKVDRGSAFALRSELFYGTFPAVDGTADICAAALGVGTPLTISGEIARLVVKPTGGSPAVVTIKTVDLRSVDNERTEIGSSEQYETPFVPKASALMQNFPNPFNPVTTLTFDVAQPGSVTIQVFDVSGRLVATLLNGERLGIGRHHVDWNGINANGSLVPSGIYFYRMKTAGFEATRKMILVR